MPTHLFVYGTLRAGSTHPLARRLSARGKLIGTGTARGTMYDLGTYPGAMFGSGHSGGVIGDVFALAADDRLLAELDAYEGTAIDDDGAIYERIPVAVKLDSGRIVEAQTYALHRSPDRPRPIRAGDWIAHSRKLRPRSPRF